MAGAIANFKPTVIIPPALDNLFRRAIEARTLFTQWYEKNSHDGLKHKDPSIGLSNRFSELKVETPFGKDTDVAAEGITSLNEGDFILKDVVPVALLKSEEDVEADFLFAIGSFMLELQSIRGLLESAFWSAYREGFSELILCSLATNTAIQLVRRAEHQLDLMIERPKKYPASMVCASYVACRFVQFWVFPNI
ncbi:hypothetical protein F5Y16DRAFT_421743 [Xylariaceae sp. FL0255]|nr:hypothetical protein F5Y16DRAFT_421743 [Xylariaceae sp. FL0255]